MLTRILLLFSISWIIGLTAPLFAVLEHEVSGRDLVLIAGGLFLLTKSTREIHDSLEGDGDGSGPASKRKPTFVSVLVQIAILDIVFSLDSVITAVGMADDLGVMVTAVMDRVIPDPLQAMRGAPSALAPEAEIPTYLLRGV